MSASHARRRDVQGLRAVAVGLVIANHVFAHPVGGFVGVDVFFVISGYLITGLLLREQGRTGRVSIRAFYARRLRRILPLALLVLVSTALGARLALGATRAHQTWVDALWAAGFSANLRFSRLGTDYFAQGLPVSPVQHYWSLAVEEQFYVLWPVLLLVLLRVGRRAVTPVLLVGTFASFAWCVHLTSSSPTQAYFASPARAWELGAGALLAFAAPHVRELSADVRGFAGWSGAALLAFAAIETDPLTFPGAQAAVPVLAGVLLLAAGEGPAPRWGVSTSLGRLTRFGDLSYALYLWHLPVLVVGTAVIGGSTADRWALVGASLALSVASYRWVEQPALRSGWLIGPRSWALPRRGLVPLVTGLVVALFVGITSPAPFAPTVGPVIAVIPTASASSASQQALSRNIEQALAATTWPRLRPTQDQAPAAQAPEFTVPGCFDSTATDIDACTFGLKGASRDVVVVGDSMAISWLPGIRQALEPRGYRIRVLAYSTCPFADVQITMPRAPGVAESCNATHARVAEAVRRLRPALVIASDIEIGINHVPGTSDWTAGLARQIRAVQAPGTRVVVLSPPPSGHSIDGCTLPRACISGITANWGRKRTADRAAAKETGATYVDASSWFCDPRGRCPIFAAGTPVRWDGYHLTAQYSRMLAPELSLALLRTA